MNYNVISTTDQAAIAPASFTIERAPLLKALNLLARHVVEKRNQTPILSNVLFYADDAGQLYARGTDLEMTADIALPVSWEVPGAFTVSLSVLIDLVKKADKNAQISFSYDPDAGRCVVSHGRARQSINTLPADDFPVMPVLGNGADIFFLSGEFQAGLDRVAPFMSAEQTPYYLNGAAFDVRDLGDGEKLYCVATNGHVLSANAFDVPEGFPIGQVPIPPLKLIKALNWLDHGPVSVEIEGKKARFELAGGITVFSKLIDGTFPDWTRVVPSEELDGILMPELDTRLSPAYVDAIKKSNPHRLNWERDGHIAKITSPDCADWFAILMGTAACIAPKGYDWGWDESEAQKAQDYLAGLARDAGFPEMPFNDLKRDGPLVRGATFGERHWVNANWKEVVCYDTFTTSYVKIEGGEVWTDGSYSIVMPREREMLVCDVTVDVDGKTYPVATKKGCEIHLTADTVRELCGPVGELEPLECPKLTFHHGRVIAVDGVMTDGSGRTVLVPHELTSKAHPKKMRISDRDAMAAYCADPAGYMQSLAPQYYDNTPSAEYEAEITPVEAQEDVSAHSTSPEPENAPVAPEIQSNEDVGQDRDAYADEQDREGYTADPKEAADWQDFARVRFSYSIPAETPSVGISDEPPIRGIKERSPAHVRAIMAYLRMREKRSIESAKVRAAHTHIRRIEAELGDWEECQHRTWETAMGYKMKRRRAVLLARDKHKALIEMTASRNRHRNARNDSDDAHKETKRALFRAETALAAIEARANGWPPPVRVASVNFNMARAA